MPIAAFNGDAGEQWTNESERIAYQLHAVLRRTCGYCLSYHMAVKYGPWPIPFHPNCRCYQAPIAPGRSAAPFVDVGSILSKMTPSEVRAAVGASNWLLVDSGLVRFADVVGSARVKSFREVVAEFDLSSDALLRAGVRPAVVRAAERAVRSDAVEAARLRAAELVQRIEALGRSREDVVRSVGERFAARIQTIVPPPNAAPTIAEAQAQIQAAAAGAGAAVRPDDVPDLLDRLADAAADAAGPEVKAVVDAVRGRAKRLRRKSNESK